MCYKHGNSLYCIIPPDIFEHMATLKINDVLQHIGIRNIEGATIVRTTRALMPADLVSTLHVRSHTKYREVYDVQGRSQTFLPGKLVRSEGDPEVSDENVNQAYDYAGKTYDFYHQLFNRNSLDDKGMALISSVHLDEHNAFWNGQQMMYGVGIPGVFNSLTNSLDTVGHEFTHGVVAYTSRLNTSNESGAINEHFADVFGTLIKQWNNNDTVHSASWLIGEDIIIPRLFSEPQTRRAVRDMKNPGTAYVGDPVLGTDKQVDHISGFYTGSKDSGGVHWNSGIPNKAFTHAAVKIGGYAWVELGEVWYKTMQQLSPNSGFNDLVRINLNIAQQKFGVADHRYQAIEHGWQLVGL
jgi:Zn-dependent metalloprotease